MYYIQRKDGRELETVGEFTTYKEARATSGYKVHTLFNPALSNK